MQLKTRLLLLIVLSLLLTPNRGLAAASQFRIMLHNNTGERIQLTMTGPERISVSLSAKSVTLRVQGGDYFYSYKACGRSYSGTFKVNRDGALLLLKPCTSLRTDVGTQTVDWLIINKTGAPLNLVFSGPASYRVVVPAGRLVVYMVPGKYTWTSSGRGCGTYETDDGKLTVKKGYYWYWFCDKKE